MMEQAANARTFSWGYGVLGWVIKCGKQHGTDSQTLTEYQIACVPSIGKQGPS